MDLINKTELIAQIKQSANRGEGKPLDLPFDEVLSLILDAPEVEAVQVVYCKDCVYTGGCDMESIFKHYHRLENPFCCVGKQR